MVDMTNLCLLYLLIEGDGDWTDIQVLVCSCLLVSTNLYN